MQLTGRSGKRAVRCLGPSKRKQSCQEEKLETGRGDSFTDVLTKIEPEEVH